MREPGWPDELDAVRVVYTRGYDAIPEDISEAVIGEVRYLLTVQAGPTSTTVGGESVAFASPAATMPPAWTRAVDRYRLHRGDMP
ncbi:hypothetical protein [Amycolatopsis lurida]|uniref:Uncharacterized protein n=1 Tax=Amycolatopsis lurida NRRL 2430 TaxID=1460371 RepID=A0A2P2FYQ4_AMYLU|nr:hypothetical protein [Amycolatopsis lurida]KFU81844.1 hypothetical protein BB31_08325 [Amycolatopsis lurida NRRL 2430]